MMMSLLDRLIRFARRICAIARMETVYIARDRTTLSLILFVPAVQLLLFGYAINPNPTNIPLALTEAVAKHPAARIIKDTGYFETVPRSFKSGAAADAIRNGLALVAIDIKQRTGGAPTFEIFADASDPSTVGPAVSALSTEYWKVMANRFSSPPIPAIYWIHNPDRRTSWSIVPGLCGVVTMISMLMLGALTLVRERETGTWENLLISPLSPLEAILGKLLPYLLLGLVQTASVLLLGGLLFDLPPPNDWLLLVAGAAVFCIGHLAFGFAISAVAQSQIQAVMAAVFFYLPSMLLSGFMFPFAGMPDWAKAIGNILPLTHFINLVKDLVLKGAPTDRAAVNLLPIILFAVIALALALVFYRKSERHDFSH